MFLENKSVSFQCSEKLTQLLSSNCTVVNIILRNHRKIKTSKSTAIDSCCQLSEHFHQKYTPTLSLGSVFGLTYQSQTTREYEFHCMPGQKLSFCIPISTCSRSQISVYNKNWIPYFGKLTRGKVMKAKKQKEYHVRDDCMSISGNWPQFYPEL